MAKAAKRAETSADFDVDALSTEIEGRFDDVPWKLFNSEDLASSGETRFMVSRIQADLLKVARVDPVRAGQIWDEHVPDFVPRPVDLAEPEREDLPLNSIEPGRRRRAQQAEPFLDASEPTGGQEEKAAPNGRKAPTQSAERQSPRMPADATEKNERDDDRVKLLLDGLEKQYLKAEDKYHFRDRNGDVAFEAQEKKLLTQHETPAIVSSMIDLAETRGWSSLKLTGTDEFRREAWLQANLRDFEVSGYQPSKVDKARLAELRQERASGKAPNTMSEQTRGPNGAYWKANFDPLPEEGQAEQRVSLTDKQDQFVRALEASMRHRGDSPAAIEKAREIAVEKLTSERVHVGTLVEVGTAPYMDKRGEKPSHFVTLRDEKGDTSKVWGVDLPRALEASRAEPGQKVAVVYRGQRPVEVDIKSPDAKDNVTGPVRKTVERNSWEVVQFDRLQQDARESVARVVERQENPGNLRVFDRSAPQRQQSKAMAPANERLRQRTHERNL